MVTFTTHYSDGDYKATTAAELKAKKNDPRNASGSVKAAAQANATDSRFAVVARKAVRIAMSCDV
jgi:hypothetical protein